MVRTERDKEVFYRGLGELFDLETDPNEFDNLWDDPRLTKERRDLMVMNFDALALATDVDAARVSRFEPGSEASFARRLPNEQPRPEALVLETSSSALSVHVLD